MGWVVWESWLFVLSFVYLFSSTLLSCSETIPVQDKKKNVIFKMSLFFFNDAFDLICLQNHVIPDHLVVCGLFYGERTSKQSLRF